MVYEFLEGRERTWLSFYHQHQPRTLSNSQPVHGEHVRSDPVNSHICKHELNCLDNTMLHFGKTLRSCQECGDTIAGEISSSRLGHLETPVNSFYLKCKASQFLLFFWNEYPFHGSYVSCEQHLNVISYWSIASLYSVHHDEVSWMLQPGNQHSGCEAFPDAVLCNPSACLSSPACGEVRAPTLTVSLAPWEPGHEEGDGWVMPLRWPSNHRCGSGS